MITKIINTLKGLRDWARLIKAVLAGIDAFLNELETSEKPKESE